MIFETNPDNLILYFDTACMNASKPNSTPADSGKDWQKTQYSNLIRYVPSGTYFARLRVAGKLIRRSLKTDVLAIAKLRLADLEKNEREAVETRVSASKGRMIFGDCVEIFKTQTETSNLIKPSQCLLSGGDERSEPESISKKT